LFKAPATKRLAGLTVSGGAAADDAAVAMSASKEKERRAAIKAEIKKVGSRRL
jgi:hypothetical protein